MAEDAQTQNLIDIFQPIAGTDALAVTRDLAAKEGIFCGISGGATFAAALKVAETAPADSKILAMLPDTGERYMNTVLFDGVEKEMSLEEIDILCSMAAYRFDISGGGTVAPVAEEEVKPEIIALVARTIAAKLVVMYALEWCEFCWSVRKMFEAAGIAYESVDWDSVAYQNDDLGADIRTVLRNMTGAPTISQIFVGGERIGGTTETFDAFNDGSLKKQLTGLSVDFNLSMTQNAYSFLPTWLHPR